MSLPKSIEHWHGIHSRESVNSGGLALMIGPLEPEHPVIRFMVCTWMLFLREEEYRRWFNADGFGEIRVQYIRPQ
jgi:hypothetical protein